MDTLLIDVGACCEAHTNAALEHLHKAIGEDDANFWNPHHSQFISKLIELFTQRGLMRLDGFKNELMQWLAGERHIGQHRTVVPTGMQQRWTESEMKLVRLYLESLPPGTFTLDDYMLCVDMLCNKYLAPDALRTEAEWLATRSVLMGRVQASMAAITAKQVDTLLEKLPATVAAAAAEFPFTPVQRAVLDYASVRGCENVVELAASTRKTMRAIIQLKMAADALGNPAPLNNLQTALFDAFGELNRDWRRIALTETVQNSNSGFVAVMAPGTLLRRLEQYRGACPFCKRIDGRVLEVVSSDAPDKDGDTQVWLGKDNLNRSASPRRRQGGMLINRQPDEMYWIPAGTVHPNCRGSWIREVTDLPNEDSEFGAKIREILRKK